MYAKLTNGVPITAPKPLNTGGQVHYHPNEETYRSAEYLPVINTARPDDGKYYTSHYEEQNSQIVQVWTESEAPVPVIPEPTIEERIVSLEGEVAETKEALDMILAGVTEDEA